MDRSSISPHDMLLALIAAADHVPHASKNRLHDQKQVALGLVDWAILESDKANPQDLDDESYKAITKDKG